MEFSDSDHIYMEKLADAISSTLDAKEDISQDALDEYVHTLRIHFFVNTKEFKKRFCHGFQVLLDTLS